MDNIARKLHFIENYLREHDPALLKKMELLMGNSEKPAQPELKPMSMEEFNARIDEAERDRLAGRHISADELLEKITTWR